MSGHPSTRLPSLFLPTQGNAENNSSPVSGSHSILKGTVLTKDSTPFILCPIPHNIFPLLLKPHPSLRSQQPKGLSAPASFSPFRSKQSVHCVSTYPLQQSVNERESASQPASQAQSVGRSFSLYVVISKMGMPNILFGPSLCLAGWGDHAGRPTAQCFPGQWSQQHFLRHSTAGGPLNSTNPKVGCLRQYQKVSLLCPYHPLMDTLCKNNTLAIPKKFYFSFHLTYANLQTQNYIQILWVLDTTVHTKVDAIMRNLEHNANIHHRLPDKRLKIIVIHSFNDDLRFWNLFSHSIMNIVLFIHHNTYLCSYAHVFTWA